MAKQGKCRFCEQQSPEYIDCRRYGRPLEHAKITQLERFQACMSCWKKILTAAVVMNEQAQRGPVPGPTAVPGPGKLWIPAGIEPQGG